MAGGEPDPKAAAVLRGPLQVEELGETEFFCAGPLTPIAVGTDANGHGLKLYADLSTWAFYLKVKGFHARRVSLDALVNAVLDAEPVERGD